MKRNESKVSYGHPIQATVSRYEVCLVVGDATSLIAQYLFQTRNPGRLAEVKCRLRIQSAASEIPSRKIM